MDTADINPDISKEVPAMMQQLVTTCCKLTMKVNENMDKLFIEL